MTVLDWLAQVAEPWNALYSDNAVISTGVVFTHLAAIVVAATSALGADRRALRCVRNWEERASYLFSAPSVHRTVVLGLAVVMAAGALLFLADVTGLGSSVTFRIKLLLIALLLANGFTIMRVERTLVYGSEDVSPESTWRRLAARARTSQTLWFATILAGVALRNI